MSNDKRLQTSRTFVTNQPQHMDVSGSTGMSSTTSTADGANVVEGAVADVATTGDSAGTLSAKLRGLVKILSDIWDSVNHRIRVDGSGVIQPVSGTITAIPPALPSVAKYGRAVILVTNTAVQLSSNALVNGVIVQALSGNTNSVYVGDSAVTTANGFELQPGQATSAGVINTNDLYINGTAGDAVCFIAS